MTVRKKSLPVAICVAILAVAAHSYAQNSTTARTQAAGRQVPGGVVEGTDANSDAALEIAPRTTPPAASTGNAPVPTPGDTGDLGNSREPELPPVPTSGPPSSMVAANPTHQTLPYLGLSVQRIESRAMRGHDFEGLEIISVDPKSPAADAGLRGRGAMTTLGASGATAGTLMAPLDIALMPILKKTGQLGQTGDLIVAIDDRRVTGEVDLATALSESKPGDTIYLTVVRLATDGTRQTMKIPVKLAGPLSSP